MRKVAHVIHHTHWDPLWYFTKEDALVQFNINFKSALKSFKENRIKDYFLDGQSYVIEAYLKYHPEDKEQVKNHVETNRLFIGPFYNQIDAFITSGESILQNLKNGIDIANNLGGSNKIAYLPDTFGHSIDFPKMFNHFNIKDFVITRGVGDEYGLNNEFYFESDDGSKVLTAVMLAGYGYGTYPFKDGSLLTNKAVDYNKINVHQLMNRLLDRSSLQGEFVFPLGFDQNPPILDIQDQINVYNKSKDYRFELTTWETYLDRVRKHSEQLKTHSDELYSTQYHRIHRTLFSARSDIKMIQDKVERMLTYEVQPLASMLKKFSIDPEIRLIEKAWKMLHEGQTHASATVTDTVNEAVKARTLSAYHLAYGLKHGLMKTLARSIPITENILPLVVFSTHPDIQKKNIKLTILTKNKTFTLKLDNKPLEYTLLFSESIDGNVKANHIPSQNSKYYYKHSVVLPFIERGLGYDTVFVHDGEMDKTDYPVKTNQSIENDFYIITLTGRGIDIVDKTSNTSFTQCLYLENSGDQGDNYDYDKPNDDWVVKDFFNNVYNVKAFESKTINRLSFDGKTNMPLDLEERKNIDASQSLSYSVTIETDNLENTISINGHINNEATNHRFRLVFSGDQANDYTVAGTQFSTVKRTTKPKTLKSWKEKGYFEAPIPVYPLLNFVSLQQEKTTLTVYTRSVKEYEVIGDDFNELALTTFRSVGHLGKPDLNVRPGRPSGLDNKIIETPKSQLIGKQSFDVVLSFDKDLKPNVVHRKYARLAVEDLYHQNQNFDKTDPTITYFPMNAIKEPPKRYTQLLLNNLDSAYGTIYPSNTNDDVIRLFNAEKDTKTIDIDDTYFEVDGLEQTISTKQPSNILSPGQLKSFKRVN